VTTERHLILVVDDDEFMRDGMVGVLEAAGYAAVGAGTGGEALALLRTATVKPSLILLDLMMPGMAGWDFRTAQLRDSELAPVPVVFVSAYHHTLQGLRQGPLRPAATLEKPVDARNLLAVVERFCRDRVPTAPARQRGVRDSIAGQRFIVSCLHCRRTVIASGIIDAEQRDQLRSHLLACCPAVVGHPASAIETVLRHFRVEPDDPDDEPPPATA